jgi:hypothetical protein
MDYMNAPRLPCLFSDWNRIQSGGIPLSSVLRPTEIEPEIAALEGQRVLLVDFDEAVEATIVRRPDGTFWGEAEWNTQRAATDDELWPATHPWVW